MLGIPAGRGDAVSLNLGDLPGVDRPVPAEEHPGLGEREAVDQGLGPLEGLLGHRLLGPFG